MAEPIYVYRRFDGGVQRWDISDWTHEERRWILDQPGFTLVDPLGGR